MRISITEKNADRINDAIHEAEGRATARTIVFTDIMKDLERIEKKLGIKKKDMIGVEVAVDRNAQDFPKAYKYHAESTHYTAEKTSSGWVLTSVCRDWTRRSGEQYNVTLTDAAKEAILHDHMCFGM